MYLCVAMLKTVLLLLLAYIAYRFIFGFLIPVTRATRQVRRQFKAAQEQMDAQMRSQQQYPGAGGQQFQQGPGSFSQVDPSRTDKPRKSDYIDFEEIDTGKK